MAGSGDGGTKADAGLPEVAKGAGGALLDLNRSDRSVWLLKVPTTVANSWQQQRDNGSGAPLARITMLLDPLNPDPTTAIQYAMELQAKGMEAAKGYVLNIAKDLVPMHIFTETTQGKISVEGRVDHKFDLKPNSLMDNDDYRKLCRDRLNKSMVKTRTLQVLHNDRGSFMRPLPVSSWPPSISKDKKRMTVAPKPPEGKRIRRERSSLEDLVFSLFEEQANWALKQLVQRTDQPVAFLKEVLNDLCIYNKRGVNQGTYELKPEYKKSAEEAPAASIGL